MCSKSLWYLEQCKFQQHEKNVECMHHWEKYKDFCGLRLCTWYDVDSKSKKQIHWILLDWLRSVLKKKCSNWNRALNKMVSLILTLLFGSNNLLSANKSYLIVSYLARLCAQNLLLWNQKFWICWTNSMCDSSIGNRKSFAHNSIICASAYCLETLSNTKPKTITNACVVTIKSAITSSNRPHIIQHTNIYSKH